MKEMIKYYLPENPDGGDFCGGLINGWVKVEHLLAYCRNKTDRRIVADVLKNLALRDRDYYSAAVLRDIVAGKSIKQSRKRLK